MLFLAVLPSWPAAPRKKPHSKKLDNTLSKLISEYPAVARGHVGFKFVDLANGAVLAEQGASEFFTPASNTKLYTTAAALARLGPGYRFQTELRTSGPWVPGKTVLPDLQIVGGGDPNLSGRVLPYDVHAKGGDALAPLRELSKQLAVSGVKEINGDVTGVSTRYPGDLFPDGWTIDDSIYEYGAPVSALTFNDNAVSVTVTPGDLGDLAAIDVKPAGSPLIFLNQVATCPGDRADVHVQHPVGSNEIVLSGTIGQNAARDEKDVAVIDPARWTASELIDALRAEGITVRGQARALYETSTELATAENDTTYAWRHGPVMAVHQSAPLSQDITVTNKASQNLHAEMLLREIGYVATGAGTLKAGLAERNVFLQALGISPEGTGVALADGSGLARQGLTTPDSTVTLLRAMWQRPERDAWLASLPVGGIDGTLEHRFKNISGANRVHAKTGSLAHVNAMSGYIETKKHGWIAFSIMVNATAGHEADVRAYIDRLCALFLGV